MVINVEYWNGSGWTTQRNLASRYDSLQRAVAEKHHIVSNRFNGGLPVNILDMFNDTKVGD
jgi:hypothetical protein